MLGMKIGINQASEMISFDFFFLELSAIFASAVIVPFVFALYGVGLSWCFTVVHKDPPRFRLEFPHLL